MVRRALVTGVTGQDGAYLAKLLLSKGYEVYGTFRRLSTPNFWRLQVEGIYNKIHLISADLIDGGSMVEVIKLPGLDEVYHLAAQSYVGASFEQPISTAEVTALGTTRLLEAIRHINPKIKFYQASTSELYGNCPSSVLTENSAFYPCSPYASAKLYAYWLTRIYREGYGIYACNGILFNHESPLRGLEFVTRKVSNAVAKIKLGLEDELCLGNLDAKRDWGYAPDYVEAMWAILQQKDPEDFVIATNESHSVREFAEKAFDLVGLNSEKYIKVDKKYLRPVEVHSLCGDYSKAKQKLHWEPKVRFNDLVELMVSADLDRWSRWQQGERFPWDAPNYPSEDGILSRYQRIDR